MFLRILQEDQLLQKFRYMDLSAIVLILLFAGIPAIVALAG
jgi:hypothetical protein